MVFRTTKFGVVIGNPNSVPCIPHSAWRNPNEILCREVHPEFAFLWPTCTISSVKKMDDCKLIGTPKLIGALATFQLLMVGKKTSESGIGNACCFN